MALLHSSALCFGAISLNFRPSSWTNRLSSSADSRLSSTVKASGLTLTPLTHPSSRFSSPPCTRPGRVQSSIQESPETDESSLVVCFGEMLIDFVPTISGLALAESPAFKKAPGGAPANVAVGIARLGGSSAFIGKVGEDEFGYMLAEILKENNVNNEGMRFDPGARTALAFVTLKKDGEREFMFYRNPSADMLLEESELDLDLIRKAKIFHYGSISLITEPCKSAHIAATKVAKDAGVLLSYDPNLRLPLWPSAESAREGILSIWDTADIIKISEEEIVFLTNGADPYDDEVVRKLYHPNLKLLLVTEGPDGCRYYTKDENRLREALRFANACGAITVTERGAIPALPTREAVMNALMETVA
ncbi:Carbohydrate kinase PfkB [Cynara cardunculus var. scolymus]|uniref:fructokinase n=1 Tax=Cynara cardunculus var. scolymus TaxID=59895 RepID=A0A103YGX6_CYNCS|nr:Carbohydrate kinase PfkB [Cynara cardunculus var. scolymus]